MNTRALFMRHLAPTSPAPLGLEISSANGIYLRDSEGKVYRDLISGIAVSNLGHAHPEILKTIEEQASRNLHLMVYGELIQAPQVVLAKKLSDELPASLDCCYFVNSGSEAVEGAMKLARRYTGRSEIFSFNNAYHGSSMGALSLMGCERLKSPFRPLLPGIRRLRLNHEPDLIQLDEQTAAVIIEPIQGEAGIRIAELSYLKALRKRCSELGILLIFDEIQSGMGRCGSLFRFMQCQVIPDVLLTAKAFGGGLPLGAFIAGHEIMKALSENPVLGHITTFGGHPLSCATAITALRIIHEEGLMENAAERSLQFSENLRDLPGLKEIRRCGLLMALDFGDAARVEKIVQAGLKHGLLLDWFLFDEGSVRIAPPLTITKEETEDCCERLRQACRD